MGKLFSVELCPAQLQVPVSFYGCQVQRRPIPGFAVRTEYPRRQEVRRFLQSTLLSLRAKTTFMHQVLQPPRASAAWDLSSPSPSSDFVSSCKPQWGWLQNPDEAGAFPWTYAEANGCYRMTLLTTTEGTDAKRHQCSYCSLRDEKGFRQSWRNTCPAFEPVEETPG